MQGGKRLGARGARAARTAAAVVVAGLIATVVVTLGPSSRTGRASARSDAPTTSPPTTRSTTRRPTGPPRVDVFGDSLTAQASGALGAIGRAHGFVISVAAFPGLAPCDYARSIRKAIASRPAVLVLAFSGNNVTPCMQSQGYQLTGAAYYAKYRADLDPLVALASARGVAVELVAPPTLPGPHDVPPRAPLVVEYARLAFEHANVQLVKTAAALGGPAYVTTLPCVTGETAALGCRDGRIAVRNAASPVHFDEPRVVPCPTATDRCIYSAGAHRYAVATIDGLAQFDGLGGRAAPETAGIPVDATRAR